jgi:hypothetical protein
MGTRRPVFIIGVPRSGTTALAELVSLSLGVEMVRGKESHFLAVHGLPRRSGGSSGPAFDRLRAKTIADFNSKLSPKFNQTGFLDASADSLYYSSSAVDVLNRHFPDARLIAILRNPVDRAESAHRFTVARGHEKLSIPEALRAEPNRIAQGWTSMFYYADCGRYVRQIEALGEWRARTLFLQYESDLGSETLMDRIAEHTGYPVLRQHPLMTRNEAHTFKSTALSLTLERIRSTKMADRAPTWLREQVRTKVVDRLRTPAKRNSDPAAREILKAHFQDDSDRLAELTGLDVSSWFR